MEHTLDLPSNNPTLNKRLGYALPTSILLPPFLAMNSYFVEYTKIIDTVFDVMVTPKIEALGNLRNMWVTSAEVEEKVVEYSMIDFADWSAPEKTLLIKQVNLLGMKLSNSGIASDAAYLAISRFVGMYWFEKGRQAAIDFINFCLDQDFKLVKLWTNDYTTFVEEGDPSIGVPVWEGGTWYQTTHVAIIVTGGLNFSPQVLTIFFDDIANYNLVLHSIDQRFNLPIVTGPDSAVADIVAIAVVCDNALVISNVDQFGADPPELNTFDWVSTQFYSTVGPQVSYFLGRPSGWIATHDGKKLPVYGKDYQVPSFAHSLPTKCYGDGKFLCGDNLVWIKVPGSNRSPARIPAYLARTQLADVDAVIEDFISFEVMDVPIVNAGIMVDAYADVDCEIPDFLGVTTFVEGMHPRIYYGVSPIPITSPKGFYELSPYVFVPYW